ncbi:MAG: hypothetical protein GXO02_01265, partial [Epsilonproteobacteria bacterium]|nr:hypothetical protein [Campylobacterota bacterium]
SQLNSLRDKETLLKDKISNKHIIIKNRYLYKIYVKKGEFVLTNSLLAKVMDISKAKLTIFLSKDELKDISKKKIFINGKETKLKFYKIWKVADEKFISDYRAEIVLKPVYKFSTLVKVEIK